MPSPTYVDGATGMLKGVYADEGGIKVESVEWSINDPKEYSFDRYGGHDGFAHGFNPSVEITISGEVSDTTGAVPVAQFGTAITFNNEENVKLADSASTFANVANTGGFYPEEITFSESRDGFRSMTIRTISHPEIT
tara:strand:+ start:2828 stop:3238 length:411 start_codon:yes stop_codon:yes gene_type:complete